MRGKDKDGGKVWAYAPYLLFALALAVRVYFTPAGLLHTDSAIAVEEAERTVLTGRLHYLQGILGYPGFAVVNSLIFWAYHTLTGASSAEGVLIFSSAFFGSLGVALTYLLTLRLTGSRMAGVFAAVILCFLPLHLSLSTYVKDQVLGTCVLLILSLTAIEAGKSGKLRLTIATGCLLGYAMAIRQQEILFLPIVFLFYYLDKPLFEAKKVKGRLKFSLKASPYSVLYDGAVVVFCAAAVFVLFFVPKMIEQPDFDLWKSLRQSSGESAAGFGLITPQLSVSLRWVTQMISGLGWLLLLSALYVNFTRNRRVWFALVAWTVLYFMFYGNLMGASPYFFFNAFPPAAMLMGWGLEYAYVKWGKISLIVPALLVILMLSSILPVLEYRKAHCGPCEFAKRMGATTSRNSVVIGMDETRHYEYYARVDRAIGHPNALQADEMGKHLEYLRGEMRNGTGVYITTAGLSYDFLPQGMFGYNQAKKTLVNLQTKQTYDNLLFDPQSQAVFDNETQTRLYPQGAYGLQLFNTFKATPLYTMESEDWHHKDLELGIYDATLYKLTER